MAERADKAPDEIGALAPDDDGNAVRVLRRLAQAEIMNLNAL